MDAAGLGVESTSWVSPGQRDPPVGRALDEGRTRQGLLGSLFLLTSSEQSPVGNEM